MTDMIRRCSITIPFPILDSFPNIFTTAVESQIGVRTSLSTSTRISNQIKNLRIASRLMTTIEERESLSNNLNELAEAYEEGWDGDGGDESDE